MSCLPYCIAFFILQFILFAFQSSVCLSNHLNVIFTILHCIFYSTVYFICILVLYLFIISFNFHIYHIALHFLFCNLFFCISVLCLFIKSFKCHVYHIALHFLFCSLFYLHFSPLFVYQII